MVPDIIDDLHQKSDIMVRLSCLHAHVILHILKQIGNQGIYLGADAVV